MTCSVPTAMTNERKVPQGTLQYPKLQEYPRGTLWYPSTDTTVAS
jgi:hypothetical protein